MPDQSVDASIYGDLDTQGKGSGNLLGMAASAASTMNAMNQNRAFQLQIQSRYGMADAAKQAIGPDGHMDWDKYGELIAKDPRTAYNAPEVLQQLVSKKLIDAQTFGQNLKNQSDQYNNMLDILAPGLAMGNNVNSKWGKQVLGDAVANKLIPVDMAVRMFQQIGPDQQDGSNPAFARMLKQLEIQTKNGRDATNQAIGTWSTVDQGTNIAGGYVSPYGYGTQGQPVAPGFNQTQNIQKNTPTDLTDVNTGKKSTVPISQVPGQGQVGGTVQNVESGTNPTQTPVLKPPVTSTEPGGGNTTGRAQAAIDWDAGTSPMAKVYETVNQAVSASQPMVQTLAELSQAMKAYVSGPGTGTLAGVGRWLDKYMPEGPAKDRIDGLLASAKPGVDPKEAAAAIQEGFKLAWPMALQQYRVFAGAAPRANQEVQVNWENFPTPEMMEKSVTRMYNLTKKLALVNVDHQTAIKDAVADLSTNGWPGTPAQAGRWTKADEKADPNHKAGTQRWSVSDFGNFESMFQQGLMASGRLDYSAQPVP